MKKNSDTKELKEAIRQLRLENAIKDLKKEIKKYNKKNIFGITIASSLKRRRKKKNNQKG